MFTKTTSPTKVGFLEPTFLDFNQVEAELTQQGSGFSFWYLWVTRLKVCNNMDQLFIPSLKRSQMDA